MARVDDRRAASMFEIKRALQQEAAEAPRRLAPAELLAVLAPKGDAGDLEQAQQRDSTREQPAGQLRDWLAQLAETDEPRAVYRGERQARHYADMEASHRAAELSKPADRTDAPEIARAFEAAGKQATEQPAGNFDRDAADAAWQAKVDAAGIAQGGKSDPPKARSAEPRETILEDYYPHPDPTEAQEARRAAAGTSTPLEASTGSAAPQSGHSAGIWSGFTRAAENLARMLFGSSEAEATAASQAKSVERHAAEAGDAVDARAERMAELLRVTEHEEAEATETEEHDESRKRGRSL